MTVIWDVLGLLLVAAMAAVVVGLGAVFLGRRKDVYLYGVGAMAAAFIASGALLIVTRQIYPSLPAAWWTVLVGPAVEEAARVAAILLVAVALQQRRDWLLFGMGYALFETAFKILNQIPRSSETTSALFLAGMILPVVPLLLHVFLSLVAIALFRRGATPASVFAATFALHALHNASSVLQWWAPTDTPGIFLMIGVRSAVFLVLIALILRASVRLRR
jgi:hypothetical protein